VSHRSFIAGAGLVAALVAGCVAAAAAGGTTDQRPDVVIAQGDDRLPSTTVTDWVTYADHVVVVVASTEKLLPPTRTELERGEGLLGRTVTLQVTDVLWSRDGAPPVPKRWDYHAVGATFTGGHPEKPTPVALYDQPRLERGHRYIMAITWEEPRCSSGDVPQPGQWMGLGEGSQLPFDGGVIGQGENQGRSQNASQARAMAAEAGPNWGLEERMAGKDAAALSAELRAAVPEMKRGLGAATSGAC
jgi:hypothetical protein